MAEVWTAIHARRVHLILLILLVLLIGGSLRII
jgi:hypothetical protein